MCVSSFNSNVNVFFAASTFKEILSCTIFVKVLNEIGKNAAGTFEEEKFFLHNIDEYWICWLAVGEVRSGQYIHDTYIYR